jgi:hypothetical protein
MPTSLDVSFLCNTALDMESLQVHQLRSVYQFLLTNIVLVHPGCSLTSRLMAWQRLVLEYYRTNIH